MTADTAPSILASMTGFARLEATSAGASWAWEARSVNSKGLEVRTRLASGFERLEATLRAALAQRLKRGSINVNLSVTRQEVGTRLRINQDILQQFIALAREMAGPGVGPASIDGLLALRGVVEVAEDEPGRDEALAGAIEQSIPELVNRLVATRAEEGERLRKALAGQVARIEALVEAASARMAVQPAAFRERLLAQLREFGDAVPALSPDRLAQEVALLLVRGDIREELDRLISHVAQARDLLEAGGAVGRRLDFLCQEFNREANTLCSKSTDVELTRIGLDLKVTIEQFREQVQNIE